MIVLSMGMWSKPDQSKWIWGERCFCSFQHNVKLGTTAAIFTIIKKKNPPWDESTHHRIGARSLLKMWNSGLNLTWNPLYLWTFQLHESMNSFCSVTLSWIFHLQPKVPLLIQRFLSFTKWKHIQADIWHSFYKAVQDKTERQSVCRSTWGIKQPKQKSREHQGAFLGILESSCSPIWLRRDSPTLLVPS